MKSHVCAYVYVCVCDDSVRTQVGVDRPIDSFPAGLLRALSVSLIFSSSHSPSTQFLPLAPPSLLSACVHICYGLATDIIF